MCQNWALTPIPASSKLHRGRTRSLPRYHPPASLREINGSSPLPNSTGSVLKRAFRSIKTYFKDIYGLTVTSITQICYTKEQNHFFLLSPIPQEWFWQ